MTAQNLPNRFVADPIAKFFQFSLDAVIAPLVFSSEFEHHLDDLGLDWGSPRFLHLLVEGPLAPEKLALPPE